MPGLTTVRGRMAPLPRDDIDTDQIMPKQFLTRVERTGYGDHVFHEWRRDPDFVLNDPRFAGATIFVTGRNFGSGSSREHAVWGLQQYGFQAVLAPSFSDIFIGNCAQSGLLPACVDDDVHQTLLDTAAANPTTEVVVDLRSTTVTWAGHRAEFDIDPMVRETLLHGLDDVQLILGEQNRITAHELRRPVWFPRVPAVETR